MKTKNYSTWAVTLLAVGLVGNLGRAQDQTSGESVTPESRPGMLVYDKALGPGWQNWSWAKVELSVELGASSRRPIRVEAGPWQAMYLHHEPFSTGAFKQLGLLVQGTAPDTEVRAFALIDGKVSGEGRVIKFTNQGWTQVIMPLSELAAEDTTIDGIWLQNSSGIDLPKFYVTEIRFD